MAKVSRYTSFFARPFFLPPPFANPPPRGASRQKHLEMFCLLAPSLEPGVDPGDNTEYALTWST